MDKDRARFDSAAEPTWFVMEHPNLTVNELNEFTKRSHIPYPISGDAITTTTKTRMR